ncbi:hypothetical protein BN1708_018318 [Verticillium longisporum]|uniref:Uncharacterized protein n=1 Tax=Verticillium longisporum TaxID=100787 RepID=A0A0G4M290_VERLO|nr:hypothetical protein BN1708_018318 [Verticillium longisporum]
MAQPKRKTRNPSTSTTSYMPRGT